MKCKKLNKDVWFREINPHWEWDTSPLKSIPKWCPLENK